MDNPGNSAEISRQAEYRGYVVSLTVRASQSGEWVPCVAVTLRGRHISLVRERPGMAQQSPEDAVRNALAWASHFIDQRELRAADMAEPAAER